MLGRKSMYHQASQSVRSSEYIPPSASVIYTLNARGDSTPHEHARGTHRERDPDASISPRYAFQKPERRAPALFSVSLSEPAIAATWKDIWWGWAAPPRAAPAPWHAVQHEPMHVSRDRRRGS